jgi:hypothetical protein
MPSAAYHFAGWTAPAGIFASGNMAQTTFTMPAQDVIISANFAEYTATVAAGDGHTVEVQSDGTVVAVGYDAVGQRDVVGWDLS